MKEDSFIKIILDDIKSTFENIVLLILILIRSLIFTIIFMCWFVIFAKIFPYFQILTGNPSPISASAIVENGIPIAMFAGLVGAFVLDSDYIKNYKKEYFDILDSIKHLICFWKRP